MTRDSEQCEVECQNREDHKGDYLAIKPIPTDINEQPISPHCSRNEVDAKGKDREQPDAIGHAWWNSARPMVNDRQPKKLTTGTLPARKNDECPHQPPHSKCQGSQEKIDEQGHKRTMPNVC
jgi:hypothetical protein